MAEGAEVAKERMPRSLHRLSLKFSQSFSERKGYNRSLLGEEKEESQEEPENGGV